MIIDPEESRIGIDEGQELQRDLLIRAMLIVSANDAARMLALDIAGGEAQFAEQMNQMAGALGLANTRAANVTGLDAEGQFSTASDMTRLAALLMTNASFQLTVRRTDAVLNEISYPATNDLLTLYPGADGIKTGRTTAAGWCIVASATRNNRRIIATVLGAPTEEARNAAATALLDWGFRTVMPGSGSQQLLAHSLASQHRTARADRSPSDRTCPTTASTPTTGCRSPGRGRSSSSTAGATTGS